MDTGRHSADSPLAGQTSIATRRQAGRQLVLAATVLMLAAFVMQTLYALGVLSFGFANWRPLVYVYMLWAIALCTGQVMMRGEEGRRALFILPAVLFTVAVVVFPTIFALFVSFTDWNLAARTGPHFNGLDNFIALLSDGYFWNAIGNMVFYLSTVVVQYAIAFGLALLLNAEIKGRRFFRVVFLLPFMLSPVAVAWMIGRSMMDLRSGPVSHFMRLLGWDDPSFFTSPWTARFTIAALDAWVWIPFMTILLLAGLQAMSKEVREAAKVDGATPWQAFWQITFPLMLPISITAILVRVIFLLKLADIVISATAGGPGGATDTVSSFIFRETRDRANVGYGTMLAMVYLVMIVLFLSALLKLTARFRTQEQELS